VPKKRVKKGGGGGPRGRGPPLKNFLRAPPPPHSEVILASGFPPSTKTNTSKSQFNMETVNKESLHGMHHCKLLFFFNFICII